MFNPEQLLTKIIGNAIPGLGGGKKGKKGKKWKRKGLLSSVVSGPALMTAIGLGVGAYEILKSQKKDNSTKVIPPSTASGHAPSVPPPPPPSSVTVNETDNAPAPARSVDVVPVSSSSGTVTTQIMESSSGLPHDEIAIRMIQVMVAAAHADGVLDEMEERNILDKMRNVDLTTEEKMFLLKELHDPRPVVELCAGVSDISLAKGMYMLAVAAIEIDTEAERNWLEEFGAGLGLSGEVRKFIEEHG